jgi:glycosyltransferase involved in cell wall biosynthesis
MAKLLHVLDSINPAFGGTVESVRQLIAGLSGTRHVIEIASLDPPSNPWRASWNTEVHCLGPGVSFYRYAPRFASWLKEHAADYDAVVVNGLWRYPTWGAYRALEDTQTPYFIVTHGMLDPWFNSEKAKYYRKWLFWKLLESRAVSHARAMIYTCAEERRLAPAAFEPYRCREELVLNLGVARPPERASVAGAFTRIHPELAEKYLLFLGRIHPKKGCDILLQAFAKCARWAGKYRVVVAGPDDSGLIPSLKALAGRLGIAERVTWAGPLYGEAKWDALFHAAAFVLPSHQEAFPVAVLEALSCGTPVLTTRNVNMWSYITDAEAGLVGEDTVDSAASLYKEWLTKTEDQSAVMRENALRLFQDRFECSKAAIKHVSAIENCLKSRVIAVQGRHIHETSPNCCS